MLEFAPGLVIDDGYLEFRFARSGGPGGQHVNRTETKAELYFDFQACPVLTDGHRARLRAAHPSQLSSDGRLLLKGERYRSRERNRADVLERLAEILRATRLPPRRRVPTRPSRAQKRKRLEEKRKRSEVKRRRRDVD